MDAGRAAIGAVTHPHAPDGGSLVERSPVTEAGFRTVLPKTLSKAVRYAAPKRRQLLVTSTFFNTLSGRRE